MSAPPRQFRVVFDFVTDIAEELSVREGDVLTLIRDDVDGGWLEVVDAAGSHGLVPEGFVEPLPPANQPPAPPTPSSDFSASLELDDDNNNNNNNNNSKVNGAPLYRVAYDFNAGHSDELTASAGQVLRVVSTEVGDGWWEAVNAAGKRGLIPGAFLEPSNDEKENPPPTASFSSSPASTISSPLPPPPNPPAVPSWNDQSQQQQQHVHESGGWDPDDFSDTDDDGSYENPTTVGAVGVAVPAHSPVAPPSSSVSPAKAKPIDAASPRGGLHRQSTSRKSSTPASSGGGFFASAFVKSGGEAYLLGVGSPTDVDERDAVAIVDDESGVPRWLRRVVDLTAEISDPKKSSKLRGMKSFISYTLSTSLTERPVHRRYKHFDWLYKQLVHKFVVVGIPPLPDPKVTGRYEDDFIEGRMRQLQQWIDRMCRHPVIASSSVFQFFLTCDEHEQQKWKEGKRRAEADPVVGGNFFRAIRNSSVIQPAEIEGRIEAFKASSAALDEGIDKVISVSVDTTKKMQIHFKNHYRSVGRAFQSLSNAFVDTRNQNGSAELRSAIESVADAYNDMGEIHEAQPKFDWIPLVEKMTEQKGVLATFPSILQTQAAAAAKTAELQRMETLSAAEMEQVVERNSNVGRCVVAEIEHFEEAKNEETKEIFRKFLREQLDYQLRMQAKLKESLAKFQSLST